MTAIVVMGIAGCGKTTVARALADRLGAVFVEGDDLHPAANVAKMSAGIPLDDDDRGPWLDAVNEALRSSDEGQPVVAACSALKATYRQRLRDGVGDLVFVHLVIDEAEAVERLSRRRGHYMQPSMVASQLADLEAPDADEAISIDAGIPVDEIVESVVDARRARTAH